MKSTVFLVLAAAISALVCIGGCYSSEVQQMPAVAAEEPIEVPAMTTITKPFYPVSEFDITGPFEIKWHYSPTENQCKLTMKPEQSKDIVVQATGTTLSVVNEYEYDNNFLLRLLTLGMWKLDRFVPKLEITTSLMPTQISLRHAQFFAETPIKSPELTIKVAHASVFRCDEAEIDTLSLEAANASSVLLNASGDTLSLNLRNSISMSISGTYSNVSGTCSNSVSVDSNLHGDTLTLKLSNSSVWGGTSTFHTVTYKGSNNSHMLLDKADTVTCKLSNSSILSIKDVSRVSGKLSNSAKLVVPKKADCSTIETSNSAGIYYQ